MSYQPDHLINLEISTKTLQASLLQGLKDWLNLGLIAYGQFRLRVKTQDNYREAIRLDISADMTQPDLLEGLTVWLNLGLLDKAWIHFDATVNGLHPALLEGLERWLQLKLLSDAEVRQICRVKLACHLPPRVAPAVPVEPKLTPVPPQARQPSPKIAPPLRQSKPSSWLEQGLQALMTELSVLWLLLLGAFMVVGSSGVLAASQWEKFPPAGQYAVLWLYTLGFGGASAWASRQPNLSLTAQSLRLITLLLVPVNFLSMDSFALWHNPLECLVLAIASLSLTALTVQLFQGIDQTSPALRVSSPLLNYLGLSYLHWGWALAGFPLMATYLGSTGTAIATLARRPDDTHSPRRFSFKGSLVMGALAILLVRALFIAHLEVTQLGLAVGIWGWMLAWQTEDSLPQGTLRERIGGSLLVLGWLLSVDTVPWQAMAVSGLALLFFARRLLRSWLRSDLIAILGISFQSLWLGWRLIPISARQSALTLAFQITGAGGTPWSLLSVTLFPYLIGLLALTDWLARRNKRELSNFSGWVALGLGSTLTVLSLVNPLLRTLNLTGSTLALGVMLERQSTREGKLPSSSPLQPSTLAALTHIGGLLALGSALDWQFPVLSLGIWSGILLVLMVAEFALSLSPLTPLTFFSYFSYLRPTAWNLALILGGLSYCLLLLNQSAAFADLPYLGEHPADSPGWGALWLLVPLTLVGIGSRIISRRTEASWLSVASLGAAQLLTLGVPETRLIGLGVAAGVMLSATYNLRHLAAAAIAVGFGLAWVGELLRSGMLGLPPLSGLDWELTGAIAVALLWLLRHRLSRRATPLTTLYAQAVDGWAIALGSLNLLFLLSYSQAPTIEVGVTSLCLMVATAYRSWQPPRSLLAVWLSLGVFVLAQIPAFGLSETRWAVLGIATGLAFVQVQILRHEGAAVIAIGLALGLLADLLGKGVLGISLISVSDWLLAGVITAGGMWGLRHGLVQQLSQTEWRSRGLERDRQGDEGTGKGGEKLVSRKATWSQLAELYARPVDGWALTLCGVDLWILLSETAKAGWVGSDTLLQAPVQTTLVVVLLMAASAYRSWQPQRQSQTLWLGILTLLLAQIPLLFLAFSRSIGLGVATLLMLVYTRYLQDLAAATLTLGLGLGFVGICLWDGFAGWTMGLPSGWLLVGAISLLGFSGLRHWLAGRTTQLARIYRRSVDGWTTVLCLSMLFGLTLHSLGVYWHWTPVSRASLLAAALTLAAIAYRSWQEPNNWTLYGVGWGLELLTIEVLDVAGRSIIALAIANTVLGLLAQILGDWWHRRASQRVALSSWHILPLLYGALGSALRWGVFSSWTGLSSLGLVFIAIGVGRRTEFKPLLYLAIAGISLAAYELLLYQVAGLPLGERLLAMAALAASIMYAYRLLTPWLTGYLHLAPVEFKWVAHLHWALGTSLLLASVNYPATANPLVGLGAGLFFTRYAIWQGRNHPNQTLAEIWVYLGLLEAAAISAYAVSIFHPGFLSQYLSPWSGAITAIAAAGIYSVPWASWGWPPRPWHLGAIVLPLLGLGFALSQVNLPSVWIGAGFYAWLAWRRRQPRWTYLSLLLVNWAIALWLQMLNLATPFAYFSQVGFSLLYLAWIEPTCRREGGKGLRHVLRLFGTGIICGTALLFYHKTGIMPGIISILAIFAGLIFRVRAFLYIGTATFLSDAFYQLVILFYSYPLLKWIVGLLVGIAFIAIAATFETRRAQFRAILHNWFAEFESWQ